MSKSELSDTEERALELIQEEGVVYQSDLWKELDCSAGQGSKIARSLAEQELVERKEAKNSDGRATYALKPAPKDAEDLDFSLLLAGDMLPPFIGEDEVDIKSERFTQWLMNLERDHRQMNSE